MKIGVIEFSSFSPTFNEIINIRPVITKIVNILKNILDGDVDLF